MKNLLSLALGLLISLLPARAALTLHIDTTAEEFYFSGTDIGTTFLVGGTDYIVDWSNTGDIGGTIEFSTIIAAFDLTGGGTLTDASFSQSSNGYASVILNITAEEPTLVTVTADNSVRFSYATFDEWRQIQLAAFAASADPFLINPGNTGFSDLDVNAVPEPSTYALLALGLGLLAYRSLRRRRTA